MHRTPIHDDGVVRPELHLSGEKLRIALAQVLRSVETLGGVERLAEALKLRSDFLAERFAPGRVEALEKSGFDEAVTLMATVRRRIGAVVGDRGWPVVRAALADLVRDAQVPGTADARIAKFERVFVAAPHPPLRGTLSPLKDGERGTSLPPPQPSPTRGEGDTARRDEVVAKREGAQRCVRDLAAEVLHAVYPETYPLMTRWVWDARANTGALREIWHDPVAGDDCADVVIAAADDHETFLVLREELSQFLSDNGVYRDMIWYVDILLAHVYATYINAQGGAYIKGDFTTDEDPLEHTRRLLGLDRPGGKRWRPVAGEAHEVHAMRRLG